MSAERAENGRTRILKHTLAHQEFWIPRLLSYSALSTQVSALLLLTACAIPHVPSRTVYEDPVNFVRLEVDATVLPDWPPSALSHPASISVEEMTRLLKGMTVQEHRTAIQRWFQGEAPKVPAFGEEEVALLAPRLSEALAQAQQNERVTYYLSKPQTSVKRIVTSGGLYVRGTELHFLLGNWQIIYGIPTYGMIYDRRYPMSPTGPKGFDLFFEPDQAVIRRDASVWDQMLANSKDELIIDLMKVFPGPSVSLPPPHRIAGLTWSPAASLAA